jgi:hypothetical protein
VTPGDTPQKWPFYGSSTWFLYQRDIFVECPCRFVLPRVHD